MELDDHRQTVARHFEGVFADPNEQNHRLDDGVDTLRRPGRRAGKTRLWRDGSPVRASGRHPHRRSLPADERPCEKPFRRAGAARHPGRRRHAQPRRHPVAPARPARGHRPPLCLPRPAAAISAGLEQVARIASASSWAADYLLHHPILLDELLDPRLLEMAPDWTAFRQQLIEQTDELEPDTERQMDVLREAHHAQVFRLVSQDVSGLLTRGKSLRPSLGTRRHPRRPHHRAGLAQAAEETSRHPGASPSSATASSAARSSATPPTSTSSTCSTTPRPRPPKSTPSSARASIPGCRRTPRPACSSKPTCACARTAMPAWWFRPSRPSASTSSNRPGCGNTRR